LQKEDDFRDLIALSRAFFTEYENHHGDLFCIDTLHDEEIVDYFSRFLGKASLAAFVACQGDNIVGYVTAAIQTRPAHWKVQSVGRISGLMVDPQHRREHVGTLPLGEAKAFFREHGVRYYTLYTAVRNTEAIACYESQGMEPLYSHRVGEIEEGV
jgi:ribosomal protein S18 acetylase RimI-like enzyme